MSNQKTYLVTYDISEAKRLRKIHRIMRGYGTWLQYSVFMCTLDAMAFAELSVEIHDCILHTDDHVLVFTLGNPENLKTKVSSFGKSWSPPEDGPLVI